MSMKIEGQDFAPDKPREEAIAQLIGAQHWLVVTLDVNEQGIASYRVLSNNPLVRTRMIRAADIYDSSTLAPDDSYPAEDDDDDDDDSDPNTEAM